MSRPKLTVFLDVVSPFAYMAFHVTRRSAVFEQCDVTYIPIFLGGVMKACDNRPPIQIKNKDIWIGLERQRWAKYCDIPMAEEMPDGFPPMTLHVMRAMAALEMTNPSRLLDAFAALYKAMWVEHKAVQKPEVFGAVLAEVLGEQEAKAVLEKSTQPEAKQALQHNTDLALKEHAFGLPWFVATNSKGETERYWGFDHLGQVIEHLGLDRAKAKEIRAML